MPRRGRPKKRSYGLNQTQKKQIKKYIEKEIEVKTKDITGLSSVSTTGTIVELIGDNLTQGTGGSARVGSKIILRSIYLNMAVQIPVNGDHTNIVRVLIFQWKSNTVPTIAQMLENSDYVSPYNYDNRQLYKIVYDKYFPLSYEGPASMMAKINLKNLNKTVVYSSGTATKNDVYMLMISDSGVTLHPIVQYDGRAYYYDA